MKIDSNLSPNFQPEDLGKVSTSPGAIRQPSTDQLQGFDPSTQSLFGSDPVANNSQFDSGKSVLIGARPESFGLDLPLAQTPADPAPASEDQGWLADTFNWLSENIFSNVPDPFSPIGDAAEWAARGLSDASAAVGEGLEWFGDKAWDSIQQIPGAVEDAGSLIKDGVVGAAEDVWDGGMWAANKLDDAVGTGMHAVAEGMSDVASAVGDAIGDALDW